SVSGANLIFDTQEMNYEKQLQSHEHLASGDDFFLLKEMRKNNKLILVENAPNLAVETDTPATLKSYLNQRVRWLSKSKFKIEGMDLCIGVFILFYFMGGLTTLILATVQG